MWKYISDIFLIKMKKVYGVQKTMSVASPRKSEYSLQKEIFGRCQASNSDLHGRNSYELWNDDVIQNTVMGDR